MTQLQKIIGQERYSELLKNSERSSFFGMPMEHMSREDLLVTIHMIKETEDRRREQAAKIIKRIESGETVTAEDEAYKRFLSYKRYYSQMLSQEAARSRQSHGLNALTQHQNVFI